MASSGRLTMSPAMAVTGNPAAGPGGSARSNSVNPVIGWPPSAPSFARRAASLRPRKPPPPRMEIFMIAPPFSIERLHRGLRMVHRGGMVAPYPFSLLANPRHGTPGVTVLSAGGFRRAKAAITGWEGYAPTPLRDLP